MTDGLIAPHGGELLLNMVDDAERTELQELAKSLPKLTIGSRQLADLEMLAIGAYSPLNGFMQRADYLGVVNDMHLNNGLPWSVPITLAVSAEVAETVRLAPQMALVDAQDVLQAVLTVEDKYTYHTKHESPKVHR